MVDNILASRAQTASVSDRAERALPRANSAGASSLNSLSRLPELSQRAFGSAIAKPATSLSEERKVPQRAGSGLLGTDAQILLAESRSQEASAAFYPPSRIEKAITTYLETQTQVRDTIRATSGGFGGNGGLISSAEFSSSARITDQSSSDSVIPASPGYTRSPLDGSIDSE